MRTCRFYKYLMAMIIALGTTANIFAQQKNLKIYFKTAAKQDVENNSTPDFQFGGDVPAPALGLQVKKLEGVRWANGYRWFSGWHGKPTDRLIAAYVDENTKMDSKLKMEFENFPFEVNAIQWNAMNDLLSDAIFDITEWDTDIFDNYTVNYKYTPKTGNDITGSEQHWDLNIFTKRADFNQGDMPGASNMAMKGLTSFEFSEENYFKVTIPIPFIGGWTLVSRKTALNDNCRTFIKAGWEEGMGSLPADGWAFNIKYSLPTLALRFADGRTNDSFIVDENNGNGVSLQAYISAHAGAIEPGKVLTNNNRFYYEYVSRNTEALTIEKWTGLAHPKKVGDVNVTVYLKFGQQKEDDVTICSYTKTLHIIKPVINESSPKICIGFVDGNKGYDVTVGDQNAQIQGFITANTPTDYSTGGYQFEYYESSNGEIITIDPTTGKITPKKEGDVNITAVLKKGNMIVSNPYTYTLHVFAQHEGLEWQREDIYAQASSYTANSWKVDNNNSTRNWQASDYLKTKTTILENNSQQSSGSSTDSWKQITWFTTGEFDYWRPVCQKIKMDVHVPKYSKATATYRFAGNVTIGEQKGSWLTGHGCKYGFEVMDLGLVTSDQANSIIRNIKWDTTSSSETLSSSDNYTTIVRNGADNYTEYVGAGSNPNWETDNSTGTTHISETRYLAVMAYLWNNHSYPGDFSVGYKDIPTYTYYAKVTYAKNDGTDAIVHTPSDWETTTSKTETFKLFQGASNSEKAQLSSRAGYTFLGWSTDPNATTPEYELEDDFPIYDNVNGGGMGPDTLYAVWKPNTYVVTLNHNYYVNGSRPTETIDVVYAQPMPDGVKAPVNTGYDFTGYRSDKNIPPVNYYYDADMKSVRNYDKAQNFTLYANWQAHKSTVVFDLQGGQLYYGATEIIATYNQDMPIEGLEAPHREGYTFGGYYYNPNGAGTQYYTASMTSARKWNIDERLLNPQVAKVTLYAKWIANTYTVTLDPQGGTGGTTSVTATYGQKLPSGLTAPTKEGYEFKGYYSNANQDYAESIGQDYGGKQYYDKDMNGVEPWDKTEATTIYAHWAPKTYIVTFDLGDESHAAIFPDNVVSANKDRIMEITSDGKMKVSFDYGISGDNSIDLSVPKKPGYEMLGWYDANGDLIVTVDSKDRHAYITDKNNYWQKDGNNVKWNYADDLVLTAKFRCKYTVEDAGNGPIIKFDNEIVEPDQDWLSSVISDLQGAAKEVGTPENPVMAFDLRTSKNIWTGNKFARLNVMESLQSEEYKDYISPNVLVYFNDNESEAWYIDGDKPEYQGRNDADCYNAVSLDNKCRNLVVTDRYRIKIPYAFDAQHASYARDANVASGDAAKDQAKNSTWGTLCLPYPVKNNNKHNLAQPWEEEKLDCHVIFYELRKHSGSVMQFYKLPEDAVIPANTPVLYERTVGISSAVTIEENAKDINDMSTWIPVPENPDNTAVVKSYADAPEPSIHDWEFRGNLKTTVFYGKGYVNPPAGAQILDGDVYYFKQDKFTYLNPKMEKNGKTYQAAKMTLYPYRAYFYRNTRGSYYSSAKVSEYSILVIGEDGATLDITNEIFGDGEGDGKIYDLNGIRVMKPVKGRLYIVNGQKKVYK